MDRTVAKMPRSSDLLPMMNRNVAFYLLVTLCFIGCHSVILEHSYQLISANCRNNEAMLPCKFTHTTDKTTPPITQWRMLDADEVVGSINSSRNLNPGPNFTDLIRLVNMDTFDSSIYITDINKTPGMEHVFSCEVDIASDTESPRKKHIVVKMDTILVYAVIGITIQCAGIVLAVLVIFFAFIPLQRPCTAGVLAVNVVGICLCVTGIVLSALYLAQKQDCTLQYPDIFCWAGLALGAVGFLLPLVAAIGLLFLLRRVTKPTDKPSESRESHGYVVPSKTKM